MRKYFPIELENCKWSETLNELDSVMEDTLVDKAPRFEKILESHALVTATTESVILTGKATAEAIKTPEKIAKLMMYMLAKEPSLIQQWHQYRWKRNSRTIYDISSSLTDAFNRTKINVSSEDIYLPFPTIYIAVPQGKYIIENEDTGNHNVDGFFVSHQSYDIEDNDKIFEAEVRGGKIGKIIQKKIKIAIPDGSYVMSDFNFELQHINQLAILAVGNAHKGDDITNNALAKFTIPIPKERDNLESFFEDMTGDIYARQSLQGNVDKLKEWTKIILNTIIYIDSIGKDVVYRANVSEKIWNKSKEIKSKKQRKKFLNKYNLSKKIYYVGHTPTKENGKQLIDGHMVSSHWKWQRVGPKRKQVKHIRISAYWRGPKNNSTTARVYEIKDEEKENSNNSLEYKTKS